MLSLPVFGGCQGWGRVVRAELSLNLFEPEFVAVSRR